MIAVTEKKWIWLLIYFLIFIFYPAFNESVNLPIYKFSKKPITKKSNICKFSSIILFYYDPALKKSLSVNLHIF